MHAYVQRVKYGKRVYKSIQVEYYVKASYQNVLLLLMAMVKSACLFLHYIDF